MQSKYKLIVLITTLIFSFLFGYLKLGGSQAFVLFDFNNQVTKQVDLHPSVKIIPSYPTKPINKSVGHRCISLNLRKQFPSIEKDNKVKGKIKLCVLQ